MRRRGGQWEVSCTLHPCTSARHHMDTPGHVTWAHHITPMDLHTCSILSAVTLYWFQMQEVIQLLWINWDLPRGRFRLPVCDFFHSTHLWGHECHKVGKNEEEELFELSIGCNAAVGGGKEMHGVNITLQPHNKHAKLQVYVGLHLDFIIIFFFSCSSSTTTTNAALRVEQCKS